MTDISSWDSLFLDEIARARNALAEGNEGRSRVCARRAAGIIAEQYLRVRGIPVSGQGSLARLKQLSSLPDLPSPVPEVTLHFLLHVTEEFKLPDDIDLVADAYRLAQELLGYQAIK